MKGTATLHILKTIEHGDVTAIDLLSAFLTAGYGASQSHIEYLARQNLRARKKELAVHIQKQKYYSLIYKLRRDNLIDVSEKESGKKRISITKKGIAKLFQLKERSNTEEVATLSKEQIQNPLIIVTFDIPEKQRKKRNFLRKTLKNTGFRMLQQSVWIGKIKIPEKIIDDIDRLRIINYVEIFEVGRSGSLETITPTKQK